MLLLSREQNPENQRTILAIYCLSFYSPCKNIIDSRLSPPKEYFPADPAVPVPAVCLLLLVTTALDSEDDLVRASLVYIYRVKSF